MSDSDANNQEIYSGCFTKKEHRAYIKIECLRGNTVVIIIVNLCEACRHDEVNHSTVAR